MSIDAMKLALEALEECIEYKTSPFMTRECEAAITALRERLAQPKQEIVCVCGAIWEGQELVSAPPQRKPLTHPQIHELDWPDDVSFEDILLFARAIEAAHGIKEQP